MRELLFVMGGLTIGYLLGVVMMCLLQINREKREINGKEIESNDEKND